LIATVEVELRRFTFGTQNPTFENRATDIIQYFVDRLRPEPLPDVRKSVLTKASLAGCQKEALLQALLCCLTKLLTCSGLYG
jgi:hypothetical protein